MPFDGLTAALLYQARFLSKHSFYLEHIMRKMIFLAVAGFVWRKFQSRYASRMVRGRRGY
ncbi:hypothetical protein [Noviherbaspirillum sp.]|uniref:hypothetical protein n=1 Tax=Noviherbaspirillum sp. TaxID=1926288 RepID=UPI002FE0D438